MYSLCRGSGIWVYPFLLKGYVKSNHFYIEGDYQLLSFSGYGADVYVPASRVEEAMALLSADICEEE